MDWTIFKLLSWTETYFKKHAIDSPRLTAEILLGFSLGIKRLDLYLQYDRPLEEDELIRFKALIKRRIQHEPVAYITGEKGFYESRFRVGPGVLIPRPDTEIMVEKAIEVLGSSNGQGKRILELGVGSGAVVISLARACPGHSYFAGDVSPAALASATDNAGEILDRPVHFFRGSWFSSLSPKAHFDLILSNPPYIPTRDIEDLAPEIRLHEPGPALDGGADGLDSIREILDSAHDHLSPGGLVLMEMGFDQKEGVKAIAGGIKAYESVEFIRDLAGHNRLVLIKKRN
ncbi:peptide chain release factor N(5)-glutamine methyltransferase [Desulfospira joergensenii]|uniref:peptide chain release factor N(5)-glutamine methyltransferase n=1 Tax=Desulfospira joergensenii TaxID=53329 RepID=UPI0003B2FC01|nr:peptide chain release factor N(5)-glutamine methyltransferase [Desulfospira joergensenii]